MYQHNVAGCSLSLQYTAKQSQEQQSDPLKFLPLLLELAGPRELFVDEQ